MTRAIGPVEITVRREPTNTPLHEVNVIVARCGDVVLKTHVCVRDTLECTELLAQEAQRQASRCCICGGTKDVPV